MFSTSALSLNASGCCWGVLGDALSFEGEALSGRARLRLFGHSASTVLDGSGRAVSCFLWHLRFLGQTIFKKWLLIDVHGRSRLKCFGPASNPSSI